MAICTACNGEITKGGLCSTCGASDGVFQPTGESPLSPVCGGHSHHQTPSQYTEVEDLRRENTNLKARVVLLEKMLARLTGELEHVQENTRIETYVMSLGKLIDQAHALLPTKGGATVEGAS